MLQSLIERFRLSLTKWMACLHLRIETPLMYLTKAQTWALTLSLGGPALVDIVLEDTHTCYAGERGVRHDWGHGCGECPACELRARGWREWEAAGRPALAS